MAGKGKEPTLGDQGVKMGADKGGAPDLDSGA